jgi:hypothetical protein
MANASKCTEKSPCTNIPIQCPLCPKVSDAMWKYNMGAHIHISHPSANLMNYEELYSISPKETILMKGIHKRPPKPKKLKMATHTLAISEGHSSWLVIR